MPKRARCPHCDRLFNRDVLDRHIQRCRSRNQASQTRKTQGRTVIVDGNNVAHHLSIDGRPNARNLILAYRSLTSVGIKPIFVVSSALMHRVDNPSSLNEFILSAEVIEAPRGTNDDLKIIQLAKEHNAHIVSNDRFLDWTDRYPWITARLKKYRMTPSGLILAKQ
ncbi:MAG: NYN domain-containing protein [Candidatus Thorarchaeota archaeon]